MPTLIAAAMLTFAATAADTSHIEQNGTAATTVETTESAPMLSDDAPTSASRTVVAKF